jgi:hypothetical protein
MKFRALTCIFAMTLFGALAIPVRLVAQERVGEEHHAMHHRYKLVDLGTLGGPESYVNAAFSLGAPNQINRRVSTRKTSGKADFGAPVQRGSRSSRAGLQKT